MNINTNIHVDPNIFININSNINARINIILLLVFTIILVCWVGDSKILAFQDVREYLKISEIPVVLIFQDALLL